MERLTNKPENGDGYSLICSDTCQNGYNCSFCEHDSEALDKLGAYEDAEEQGRLVRLPCKVGTPVWRVWITDGRKPEITEHDMPDLLHIVQWIGKFGKTVFLTREEAETALAEIEKEDRT